MRDERYVFRAMRDTDRPLVEKFFAELSDEAAGYFNAGGGNERRTLAFFENGKPDHRFFLTEDLWAEPAAAAALCFYWDVDKTVPWIGIAVAEGCRGKRIGGGTLDLLLSEMRKSGYAGALLRTAKSNAAAIGLYESRGFERLGEHPSGEYLYIKRFEKAAK